MISSKSSSSITTVKATEEMYHLTTEWKQVNITSYSGFKCSGEVCIYKFGSRKVHFGSDVYIKFTEVMNKECIGCVFCFVYSESLYIVS